ncbi:HNH endonuclease signature motif containing protein [Intestinibacter sp.]|uniref:HNH endonuclease n=1 Tax=Intestinibacter sp. TaxID=1965304 RepID=UPI00307E75AD
MKIVGNDLRICIRNIFSLETGELALDSKRAFTEQDKQDLFQRYELKNKVENGKIRCPKCARLFNVEELEVDHIIPYRLG